MFLKPDYNLKSIYDIDLSGLESQGVKAMLFDLDSTLMASKSGIYSQEMEEWLKGVQDKFFMAVVSIERVKKISNFPLLFNACKPQTGFVKEFLKKYEVDSKDCVLVGDRPLTDILCGKLLGCRTILVDSITADSESKLVRFVRALERSCIRR